MSRVGRVFQCDDVAVRFLKEDGSNYRLSDPNEKGEPVGFQIYLRKRRRTKTFFRTFRASEFLSYMEDWESWPELTPIEAETIENLFKR